MFKDYYLILAVSEKAFPEEIKKAFKKQAIKWHPDRNPGLNTTSKMQDINEAYLILKDPEARALYDREYQRYTEHRNNKANENRQNVKSEAHEHKKSEESKTSKSPKEEVEFEVLDDLLKKWMANARRQAAELAKQSLEDLVGMIAVGAKAGVKEAGSYLIIQVAITIFIIFLLIIYKSCN